MQRTILALILSTALIAVGFFVSPSSADLTADGTEVLSSNQRKKDDSNRQWKDHKNSTTSTTVAETTTTTAPDDDTTTTTQPGDDTTTSTEAPPPTGDCVLSGHVNGFTVAADQTCEVDGLVTSDANVIVEGTLVMRSGDTLRFVDVNNSKFVGGGMDPVASDVGLWVVGAGVLDAQGTAKEPWAYSWQSSWSSADDIVAAPHTELDFTTFKDVNSAADIPGKNKYGYNTEILNLSRDVKIEGTSGGYAHVFIHSTKQSTIKYVELRYLGVQINGNDASGRYALHLHHNMNATNGMKIEGVVARNIGNHAFVPHASHGITLSGTIAYDVVEEAYWWDPASPDLAKGASDPNATNNLTIYRAVAAKVHNDGEGRGSAFYLGSSGTNVKITDSVAVGVYSTGGKSFDISGFRWPGTGRTNWVFEDNISHNNQGHGTFVWQNTGTRHVVTRFDSYFNGKFGIVHGAYRNPYSYTDIQLWGNREGAIEHHANGKPASSTGESQDWTNVEGDGMWLISHHGLGPEAPVTVTNVTLPELVVSEGPGNGSWFIFENADFGSIDLSGANPTTIITGLAK
jgi:hypothetical protein